MTSAELDRMFKVDVRKGVGIDARVAKSVSDPAEPQPPHAPGAAQVSSADHGIDPSAGRASSTAAPFGRRK